MFELKIIKESSSNCLAGIGQGQLEPIRLALEKGSGGAVRRLWDDGEPAVV